MWNLIIGIIFQAFALHEMALTAPPIFIVKREIYFTAHHTSTAPSAREAKSEGEKYYYIFYDP